MLYERYIYVAGETPFYGRDAVLQERRRFAEEMPRYGRDAVLQERRQERKLIRV